MTQPAIGARDVASAPPPEPPSASLAEMALRVADHVPAMLAYWDRVLICRFANDAYRLWFGRTREALLGTHIQDLLGPLYELNRPYIERALAGTVQVFERTIPLPDGTVRESLATYTPDIEAGVVRGFFVQVADVTAMKQLERRLEQALANVTVLEGLLPICGHCKRIRDEADGWTSLERYVSAHSAATFSHTICTDCLSRHYPGYDAGETR